MSEDLVVLNSNNNQAMQLGGIGMGASIFKARPQMLELVHKSSRQENVKYGDFRVIGTNEHLGTSIRVVLLAVPQPQREWFFDPKVFSKDNKYCFSLDNVTPHPRAAQPPAMYCKTCPMGDINWEKWRKTRDPKDLPPCSAYWHLLVADRTTQTPYYLNVKGKSFMPFRHAMETQMSGLIAKVLANVKAENKKRGYSLVNLQNRNGGPIFQDFRPTSGFVLPDGATQLAADPMPNIFDISFEIYSFSKDGGPFQMGFKEFKLMSPTDKADFGQLYLDIIANKAEVVKDYEAALAEQDAEFDAVAEAPASDTVKGEVLPQGEITI